MIGGLCPTAAHDDTLMISRGGSISKLLCSTVSVQKREKRRERRFKGVQLEEE